MTEKIPVFTPQPGFPLVDLTPENERMLSVVTANREYTEQTHAVTSLKSSYIDKVNPAACVVMERVFSREWSLAHEAGFYGVILFESVLGYVESDVLLAKDEYINAVVGRTLDYDDRQSDRYRQVAIEHMRDDGMRTKEAIEEGVQREYRSTAYYAIVGAAISRQLALDIALEAMNG